MKTKFRRIICAVLILSMLIAEMMTLSFAVGGTEEIKVVVSVEGLTLGQGLYVEPRAYTLDEINALVASEGYGPYSEDELTAGMATLAMLIDCGIDYNITGTWDSDAYIAELYGLDTGILEIPEIIEANGMDGYPGNDDNDGNNDDWLGQMDYSSMSGWMITVNDLMIPVGCAQLGLHDYDGYDGYESYGNTYVIRWQFTLWGYGADLGFDTGWGMPPYFEHANKDMLYASYAASDNSAAKASALKVMENLTATKQDVAAALAALENTDNAGQDVKEILNATMAQLAVSVPEPKFGTSGGEWSVLALARGEYFETDSVYFTDYYDRIVKTVASTADENGALHSRKYTENSRLIMALSAIGKDPTNVGGVDIVAPLNDYAKTVWQGINGPIFALIALDTNNYKTSDDTIRQQYIDNILNSEISGGGWALSGSAADPDVTAMALQALAKYRTQPSVAAAAERGFAKLSAIQKDNGGYASWGSVNSESIAQVVVACTAWGIDPDTDSRFVKNGKSALDALLTFYSEADAKFRHTADGAVNAMATDQACYALVAYDRFISGRNSLYDMTDVIDTASSGEITATLSLPESIENTAGTEFNAVIDLTAWDSEAGYKLMDCIVNIPSELEVTDVKTGSRVGGGQLSYYLEEATGKLRIVHFDPHGGSDIIIKEGKFPCEFLNIGLRVKNTVDTAKTDSLTVAVSGMSLKINSHSEDEASIKIVDISAASDTVQIVKGMSFTAMTLYTGDGVDLISKDQVAVAVAVTGVADGAKILFNDGNGSISLRYSAAISEKTGVSTYVCITSSSSLSAFAKAESYTVVDNTAADAITFGDSNGDGIINAQDALSAVDLWLRKSGEPDDDMILSMNVNADSRLNTFDALGIVECFVGGDEFAVVNKAATLKNVID